MAAMSGQVSSVNVEVDAGCPQDMSKVLDQIRCQYEGIAETNRREMEAWYKAKVRGAMMRFMSASYFIQEASSISRYYPHIHVSFLVF